MHVDISKLKKLSDNEKSAVLYKELSQFVKDFDSIYSNDPAVFNKKFKKEFSDILVYEGYLFGRKITDLLDNLQYIPIDHAVDYFPKLHIMGLKISLYELTHHKDNDKDAEKEMSVEKHHLDTFINVILFQLKHLSNERPGGTYYTSKDSSDTDTDIDNPFGGL